MINKLNFSTSDYHRKLQTSVLLLLLSCLAFIFVPYIVADANAETASAQLDWSKITLELDTGSNSGNVAFNNGNAIVPDETGKLAAQSKTLTINTTGKHFNVYLSMDSSVGENQKLCFDFDASVSEKSACAHTGIGISPVSEDNDSPAKFSGNAWGYALNDGESGFSTAGTYSNASLSGDVIASTTTNSADLALYNAKWAAVPSFGSEDLIWSGNTLNPNGFGTNTVNGSPVTGDTNNIKTVVYGVQVNNDLVAGTYGSKILYTAVASASDLNSPSTNVMSSLVYGGPTDVTTLYMDIDAEGANIKERDITISLIKHSDTKFADSNNDGNFTMSELQTAKTAAVASCPVVAHSLEMENGKSLQVKCVLPDLGLNEGVDYDYIVEVPINGSLTKNYISYNTDGNDEGVTRYVGLQTLNSNDEPYVDTMQGITAGICSMTNTWGTGTGSDARIYNRTGTGQALASTAEASNALGLGTFALEDVRDNKEYLVRRLADGNCWMVQNLDLDLTDEDNRTLSPATSDVSEERTLSNKDLLAEIGSSCSEQYQPYNVAGSGCLWGSLIDANGNTISVANNGVANFARSYSNTENGNPRYVPTDQLTGAMTTYSPSGNGINVNSGDEVPTTTGYIPTTIVNSGNAVGYYGNMYIGTYYNVYSAIAESADNRTANESSNDSLCPKGWQLPNGANGSNDSVAGNAAINLDKSWTKLVRTAYGLYSTEGTSEEASIASTSIRKLPISISFSGIMAWNDGTLYDRGNHVRLWSNMLSDAGGARGLWFKKNENQSQISSSRNTGQTIRCVARDTESTTVEEEEEEAVACEAGKICYDGNGGTGAMSDQTASASSDVMLTAPTYNKLGYAFVGWNTQENGFGTTYQADETITTPSTLNSEGLQLYAKWLPSAGEMQNWSGCSTLGEHQTVALTDNRDGKTYAVRKLKDGNCWMVNNLNLELANFAGTNNLTSDNTDLSTSRTDLTDLGNGKKAWDPSASTVAKYEPGEDFEDFSLRYIGQAQPAQFQSVNQRGYTWGSKYNDSGEVIGTNSSCTNKSDGNTSAGYRSEFGFCVENNSRTEIPRSYSYEADTLYNWYAATAESGKYFQDNSNSNANSSVCPAGWRLPIYGDANTDKTWTKLVMNSTNGYGLIETSGVQTSENNPTYGATGASLAIAQVPISLNLSGYYAFGAGYLGGRNIEGDYWTSQARYYGNANRFLVQSNVFHVGPNDVSNKNDGVSVRCVNRD